jgi:hypothetical protein
MASKLTKGRSFKPDTLAGLTALQQEQLRVAGRKYDGQDLPAAGRLDAGGDEGVTFHGFLELVEYLDEAGAPAFEGVLYMVDSGTIFKAGTTDAVAEIIQFGLECPDPALHALLETVL